MTIKIVADALGGSSGDDGKGRSLSRLYKVTGINTAADNFLLFPLTLTGIPGVGDPHPRDGSMVVLDRSVALSANDRNGVEVTVNYGPPDTTGASARLGDVTRSMRSELIEEEVIRDLDGNLMQTRFVNRFSSGLSGTSISITTQNHRVAVQKPTFSLVWERVEARLPVSQAFKYSGTVNARPWLGRPADAWLMNVEAAQDGDRFRVTYTATYNSGEAGWQATIVHREQSTSFPDVRLGNGIEIRQVYPRSDFNGLRL